MLQRGLRYHGGCGFCNTHTGWGPEEIPISSCPFILSVKFCSLKLGGVTYFNIKFYVSFMILIFNVFFLVAWLSWTAMKNSGLDGWPEHRFFPAIAAAAPEWEGWCLWQELGDSNDFYGCMGGTSSTKSWSIHYQWWSSAIGYLLRKRSKKQILGILRAAWHHPPAVPPAVSMICCFNKKQKASAFISFPYLSMHAHTFGARWININQHIVLFLYEWLRISRVFAITSSLIY